MALTLVRGPIDNRIGRLVASPHFSITGRHLVSSPLIDSTFLPTGPLRCEPELRITMSCSTDSLQMEISATPNDCFTDLFLLNLRFSVIVAGLTPGERIFALYTVELKIKLILETSNSWERGLELFGDHRTVTTK